MRVVVRVKIGMNPGVLSEITHACFRAGWTPRGLYWVCTGDPRYLAQMEWNAP